MTDDIYMSNSADIENVTDEWHDSPIIQMYINKISQAKGWKTDILNIFYLGYVALFVIK